MTYEKRKDWFIFLIGLGSAITVDFIGRVYLSELLIFISTLFINLRGYKKIKVLRTVSKLGFVWLASQLITDYIRHTPTVDMVKGSVSIVFLIALLPFAYWALHDKISRWLYFYIGYVISYQINYYFFFSLTEFGSAEVWQVYSYVPLAAISATLLYIKNHKRLSYLLLFGFGLWTLFNQSRNVFLINTLTVIVLVYIDNLPKRNKEKSINYFRKRFVHFLVLMVIGLFAIDGVYENLASKGILGDYAYEKYMKQKYTSVGIASGRLEAIMDIDLISKSPIIGYGSYAKDKTNYVGKYYAEHKIEDTRKIDDPDSLNLLPRHSRIFGLWMWHGIGAGIFWFYILYVIWRIFKNGYILHSSKLLCLCVYCSFSELWDTLFSPMAIRLPLLLFLVYIAILEYEGKYKQQISIHSHC